jgi:hypothetical protein
VRFDLAKQVIESHRCKATVPQRWHTAEHQCRHEAIVDGLCGTHLRSALKARDQRGALKCHWSEDGEGSFWATGCDHAFTIIDGTPKQNGFRWCPFCGHSLEQGRR